MADAGSSSGNLTGTTSPNADAIGVDPSLDALAAFIVQGQAAWTTHDGATLNNLLQSFWAAEQALDPSALSGQSYGSLIGGTLAQDVTALDAYSHRLLGYEYMYQISQANPPDMPALVALEVPQFQASSSEFASVGLTRQAQDDTSILNQAQGMAAQDAANWVDDSYTASVLAVVNSDLAAAGNLVSNVGSALAFLTSTPVLICGAVLLGWLLVKKL